MLAAPGVSGSGVPPKHEARRAVVNVSDLVFITVFGQPDLTTRQRVSEVGAVKMPLVGEVVIAGMTLPEAEQTIRTAYIEGEFLRSPEVMVNLVEFSPERLTVLGEVGRPGDILLPSGETEIEIQRAIALAGDFSAIARKGAVRVERKLPDGTSTVVEVDMNKILDSDEQFFVRPGDIIFVPRRLF